MNTGNLLSRRSGYRLQGAVYMVQTGQGATPLVSGKLFCLYMVVSVTILAKSQTETVWDSNP